MKIKAIQGATLAPGAVMVLAVGSTSTYAGEGEIPAPYNYVGVDQGMGPKCPPVQYHVVTKDKGNLEGTAFSSGPDGLVISSVSLIG